MFAVFLKGSIYSVVISHLWYFQLNFIKQLLHGLKKGSYCTLSSKYFALKLWAFICRNNQPPCLWGLYSSKLKRETAVCLINLCRAPVRYCWMVCFPIFPQDMPPKSTAQKKSIGKSQANVLLWAHACRHKSPIHLQQGLQLLFGIHRYMSTNSLIKSNRPTH